MDTYKYPYKIKSHTTFAKHLAWIKKTPKHILKLVALEKYQMN